MKYFVIIYILIIVVCVLEAYFCTEVRDDDY